ncbi:hypothetical protein SEA_MUSETTA_105 [Microbacterium phage Musetta]|nr:hypothetical protein SEA_LYELL_106 [Microbacterium phage Lyell]AXH50260.2 hypothetical protein SEA_MUSETTA_105 [Microbacterium phage Musetta]URM87509.1 hypothetical protein SEA_DUSTYDINO_110 [Microbacterium phage DustyDino]UVK62520.1 hypothetical protein SEA_YUMA_105 [Microbacterium phage Yuma]
MKTFTDEQVTEAIEKVVAERSPDYVYKSGRDDNGCFYASKDGESPSCVVGFVVNALNPEAFRKIVEVEINAGESFEVQDALTYTDGELNISTEARRALQKAQDEQDNGKPWGEALASYKAVLGDSGALDDGQDDACDCGCLDVEP